MASGTMKEVAVNNKDRLAESAVEEEHEEPVTDGSWPTRPRTATTTAEIDSTISHPGNVKINVKGAFIVDRDTATPANGRGSPDHHGQSQDIRLPNHHAVVSHIALDVSLFFSPARGCPDTMLTRNGHRRSVALL